jgi:hypothetical protein
VVFGGGGRAGAPGRLEIGAHGCWCAVGEFLTDAERQGLGDRLKRVLAEPAAAPEDNRGARQDAQP